MCYWITLLINTYYTCEGGYVKDFTDINPSGDWDILIGESFNSQIINSLTTYFNSSNHITESGKNGVTYLSDNLGKDYVEVEEDDSKYGFTLDDKFIDSYYQEVEIFYNEVFGEVVKDYNLLLVSTSFISSQHYNSEGDKDSKVFLSEIVFNFELGYNGHLFTNNNFVKIGVNASTGDITLVKTKLLDIQETSEVVLDSDINQYIDSLPKEDSLRYVKSYSWDKITGELRLLFIPLIMKQQNLKY